MKLPLRVWATRPEEQNQGWCRLLVEEGVDVVNLPLMAIAAVAQRDEIEAVKTRILAFDEYQKVIFVSQNAVSECFKWLDRYWPQLPMGIEYFAVGNKTAAAVMEKGIDVIACASAMNSDEMLEMDLLHVVDKQKILICRGAGGLPRIGEELAKRGAYVEYCELYYRQLPSDAATRAAPYLSKIGGRDVVVLFSGETLQNFERVLQANNYQQRDMQLVVPGKRVADMAIALGFTKINIAVNASTEMMLQATQALG